MRGAAAADRGFATGPRRAQVGLWSDRDNRLHIAFDYDVDGKGPPGRKNYKELLRKERRAARRRLQVTREEDAAAEQAARTAGRPWEPPRRLQSTGACCPASEPGCGIPDSCCNGVFEPMNDEAEPTAR